jgi:hypothetical protein
MRSRSPTTVRVASTSRTRRTPARPAAGCAALDAVRGKLPQIDGAALELKAPRIDLRHEEHVAHQPQQPLRVAVDDLEVATGILVELLVVEHQLEVADDRREGRAQLMRDQREELVLEALRLPFGAHVAHDDSRPMRA